jgi:hypothetical protein
MKNVQIIRTSVNLRFTVIFILAMSFANIYAQRSQALYFMNLPQNHLMNPALRPSNRVYIGLPGISGTAISMNNNFVNFNDVIVKGGRGDSLLTFLHPSYNLDKFLTKVRDKNSIEPEIMTQLFGLGFTAGKSYIFLDINERMAGNAVIPGDLIRLALKGNSGFAGNTIDFSSLRSDVKIYHEIGFGFSRNFTERLRFGVKAKALFGVMAASLDNRSLGISIDNEYAHTLDADLTYNFSAPHLISETQNAFFPSFEFNNDAFNMQYVTGTGNMGLGLDLGMTYELAKRFTLSAAITDLGYIKWNRDVTNQTIKGQYKFTGLDITDVLSGDQTFEEAGQALADSLDNNFRSVNTANSFTTFLPFGITAGASFNLTRRISLGVLSYSRFVGKQMKQNLTMSANINLGNALSTTVTYTAANHRYDNIGAGLSFRLGWIQIYAVTDRIPLSFNKLVTDNGKSTIMIPSSWNSIDFRFGMNLVFGNRNKKEKPAVVEVNADAAPSEEK